MKETIFVLQEAIGHCVVIAIENGVCFYSKRE